MVELFNAGFGCHHAGMLRSDRNLVEKVFSQGYIKVRKKSNDVVTTLWQGTLIEGESSVKLTS
jgi:hypothetical protein